MPGRTNTAPRLGAPLLIVAVLVLGIAAMHTLGHPVGHTRHATPPGTPNLTTIDTGQHTTHPVGHHALTTRSPMPATGGATGVSRCVHCAEPARSTAVLTSPVGAGTSWFNPMSVCLAVLVGALALGVALVSRLRPGGRALLPAPAGRRGRPGSRAPPPSGAVNLAELSVLRI